MEYRYSFLIPQGLAFTDLGLRCDEHGVIELRVEPFIAISRASGLNEDSFFHGPAIVMALLLAGWLDLGAMRGDPDLTPEDMTQAKALVSRMLADATSGMPPELRQRFKVEVGIAAVPQVPTLH